MDASEKREGLATSQRRPQVRLAGHEAQAAVCLDRLPLAVQSEDLASPLGRLREPLEHADGGRLARAIGPEVADYLAPSNLKVEVIECHDFAVALREAFHAYGRTRHLDPLPTHW